MAKQTPYWREILKTSKAFASRLLKWRIKYALLRLRPSLANRTEALRAGVQRV
jgi:hypothetical protein